MPNETGQDSYSLRQLAGCSLSDSEEARKLFSKAAEELGLILPSIREAGLIIAREIAAEVLTSKITPYIGAKRIWDKVYTPCSELKELLPFVGLASEYEDDASHREEYASDIINECRKLCGSRERVDG